MTHESLYKRAEEAQRLLLSVRDDLDYYADSSDWHTDAYGNAAKDHGLRAAEAVAAIDAAPSHVALIGELVEALKAAERDAARYAWIRSQSQKDCTRWEHQGKWYTSFDDCIDAAMALSANADKGGEG